MQTLLVAGATGFLGREVVSAARAGGYRVRAMGRRPEALAQLEAAHETVVADALLPKQLPAAFDGVDLVFSSLGASVSPKPGAGSMGFLAVDTPANLNLIQAAKAARVDRFVYVSVAMHDAFSNLNYVKAHEQVVVALGQSGLDHAVLRPTGFFSAYGSILDLAAKGSVPYFGDPDVKTNPIADADLAELAVQSLESDLHERAVGGPEILTRRQILEAAFAALGRSPQFRRVPEWLLRTMLPLVGVFNPRLSDITRFLFAACSQDCVAAPYGQLRLKDYFEARAALMGSGGAL